MTDPLADLFTIIRNAYLARKEKGTLPHSQIKESICQILVDNHYLKSFRVVKKTKTKKILELELNYLPSGDPILTGIKRISRPSVRVYSKKGRFPLALSGAGLVIVSTSKGLLTDQQARSANLGGEVICQVW